MMDTTWTEQLSVGNEAIDSDHKKLIGMVDHIAHVAKERDSVALLRELQPLNDCLKHHSMKEEQFARALDIPFGMHKVAHQNLQTEIDLTMYELKKNSVGNLFVMDGYAQFLRDCLIRHITDEDMPMKPALQIYPYDFNPGSHEFIRTQAFDCANEFAPTHMLAEGYKINRIPAIPYTAPLSLSGKHR
jgi:hemerythrin